MRYGSLGLLILANGCFVKLPNIDDEFACRTDNDCVGGYVCHCIDGAGCQEHPGVCTAEMADMACSNHSDCPPDEYCARFQGDEGLCLRGCSTVGGGCGVD